MALGWAAEEDHDSCASHEKLEPAELSQAVPKEGHTRDIAGAVPAVSALGSCRGGSAGGDGEAPEGCHACDRRDGA